MLEHNMSAHLNRIIKELEALNAQEREELRRLLEQAKPTTAQLSLSNGIVRTIPPQPSAETIAGFRAWQPVTMPGESLSDELIRDRR
jgi:hypothetical protein